MFATEGQTLLLTAKDIDQILLENNDSCLTIIRLFGQAHIKRESNNQLLNATMSISYQKMRFKEPLL